MKEKIKAELPSKFVVVFDGWTEGPSTLLLFLRLTQ
jgi:hypothetical protein